MAKTKGDLPVKKDAVQTWP